MSSLICHVCGGVEFSERPILWDRLVAEWQLAPDEARYIDRQQGMTCRRCSSNLRAIALARAILTAAGHRGPLLAWLDSEAAQASRLLEVNEAGALTPLLARLPGRVLAAYPDVDMQAMPYQAGTFDLVIHSDTLEHVPNPIRALAECRRVLREDGALCCTVPTVVGRLSRSRAGLPPSFHGNPQTSLPDWAVQTEFGADAWTYAIRAGFQDVTILTIDFPSATALLARK